VRLVVIESRVGIRRDLRAMLGVLSRGRGDPALRWEGEVLWLTGVSPAGDFTARLSTQEQGVAGAFWGPGAPWAAEHLAVWVGADDDAGGFEPQHRLVARQWRRYGDTLRVPRLLLTWQVALAAVLDYKPLFAGKNVGIIISGGNVDMKKLPFSQLS
jgi:hypothetical protein